MNRAVIVAVTALAALAASPAALAQTTVAVSGDEIVVTGGAEDSRLSIAEGRGIETDHREYSLSDQSQPLAAGAGCQQSGGSEQTVHCRLPDGKPAARIRAAVGAGNDLVGQDAFSDVPVDFAGGDGNDYLIGGAGADRLDGGPGNDYLAGDEGLGGPGAGRRRGDEMIGGPDFDQVVYERHGEPRIVVSLDDAPDDGGLGEGDNVRTDVESVRGDAAAENELEGGPGNDVLIGGDRHDSIDGRGGEDQLLGGRGDDGILARDGFADQVDCGEGADRANVDDADTSLAGCEDVSGRSGPPPPKPPDPPPPTTPASTFDVTIPTASVRASRRGIVVVELACGGAPTAPDCAGRLRLASTKRVRIGKRRRVLRVGEKAFRIPAGRTARIAFRLSKAERRALRRARRVELRVRAVEQAAQPRTVAGAVTLRRPRRAARASVAQMGQVTVAVAGDEIVITGGVENSDLVLAGPVARPETARAYTVRDARAPLAPGAGCRRDGDERVVVCSLPGDAPAARIRADLGDGHDRASHDPTSDTPVVLAGGGGADFLSGGGGADRLDGGAGNDYMWGDGRGGAVEHTADEFFGGAGSDRVSYLGHGAERIRVTIDDRADDGVPGEGDNVHADVETVKGDELAENVLIGNDGPNLLIGGARNDGLWGGGGRDGLDGEGGDDTIEARDGVADSVFCGDGFDRAPAEAADRPGADCEDTAAAGPPDPRRAPFGDQPGPPQGTFPLQIATDQARPSRAGRVTVVLACAAAAGGPDCVGALRVASTGRVRIGRRRRVLTVGEKAFRIPAGFFSRVVFRISAAERRALRRAKRVELLARAVEAAGASQSVERTFTLRRR